MKQAARRNMEHGLAGLGRASMAGGQGSPVPSLLAPQRPTGIPTPTQAEPASADAGEACLPFSPFMPGVLQVFLPELLALAAQLRGPAPPQSPDAEPEEPRFQLKEPASPTSLWCQRLAGQAAAGTTRPPATRELASQDKGKS